MFENAWLRDPGYKEALRSAWGSPGELPFLEKLSRCGQRLLAWGGDRFQKFGRRIQVLKRRVEELRGRHDEGGVREFCEADKELGSLLDQEDSYWRQRAKQHWLQSGDANTRYFHQYASHRRKKNHILKLKDGTGIWREGLELSGVVCQYYEELFQSKGVEESDFFSSISPRVSNSQNHELLRPFSAEEIKAALFAMQPDKSPGPDGMNPGFFQKSWDLVGEEVSTFVLSCLHHGKLPEGVNDTTLVLIPKKSAPEVVADLRPIAGWVGLKLDMAKAYDRMEWSFLRRMMESLGFAEWWIRLIMLCVTTVRYRILINGSRKEWAYPWSSSGQRSSFYLPSIFCR